MTSDSHPNCTIRTYSGEIFNPFAPEPHKIHLIDIAHALSMLCRFGGHCNCYYSVAEHSYFVSKMCEPEERFAGLMHDAAEAYIIDLPSRFKHDFNFPIYRALENVVWSAISDAFHLPFETPFNVDLADKAMLHTEQFWLFDRNELAYRLNVEGLNVEDKKELLRLGPREAEMLFLTQFAEVAPPEVFERERFFLDAMQVDIGPHLDRRFFP